MKFIDPLTTLQYMGGSLPISVAMFIYSIDELTSNTEHFNKCRSKFSKLHYEDIVYMMISHLLNIAFLLAKFMLNKDDNKYCWLTLQHLNLTIYMMAILYVQHKLYI